MNVSITAYYVRDWIVCSICHQSRLKGTEVSILLFTVVEVFTGPTFHTVLVASPATLGAVPLVAAVFFTNTIHE